MKRFAQLGVIAAMQLADAPLTVDSSNPLPARVGPKRYRCSSSWQTLHTAGAHLSFGSD